MLSLIVYQKDHRRRPIRFAVSQLWQDPQAVLPIGWCYQCGGEIFESGRSQCIRTRDALLIKEINRSPLRTVLFETFDGEFAYGHTDDFLEVAVPSSIARRSEFLKVRLKKADNGICFGELI